MIAYEPIWAIGTGKTATPEQAQEIHEFIRSRIADSEPAVAGELPILYGGSVKADNAAELFGMDDIDGGLIGAFAISALVVPAAGWFARRFGVMDAPGPRKIHQTPTPRIGGVAIYAAFTAVVLAGTEKVEVAAS